MEILIPTENKRNVTDAAEIDNRSGSEWTGNSIRVQKLYKHVFTAPCQEASQQVHNIYARRIREIRLLTKSGQAKLGKIACRLPPAASAEKRI